MGRTIDRGERLHAPRRRNRGLDLHAHIRRATAGGSVRTGLRCGGANGGSHPFGYRARGGSRGANGERNLTCISSYITQPAGGGAQRFDHQPVRARRHRSNDPTADAAFDRTMAAVRRRGGAARGTGGRQPAATGTMIRHPLAWCVWAIAGLSAAFIDRNPALQGLLLLVVINTWLAHRRGRTVPYWKFGLALAVVPILFSAALSRFGHHVIFTLPGIPVIGGAWSWEAVVYGASTGVALLLTVAVFAVLQSVVRSADLMALLPRPLYRAGTAFALSLAFAPKTIASFEALREARRLRGQRTGWRSAPGLLVPLLLTMLEQAVQYGESLDARGYGSRRRSRYRPLGWSLVDGLVIGAALTALVLTLAFGPPAYNPYLDLAPSVPSAISVLAIMLLATPALTAVPRMHHAADRV